MNREKIFFSKAKFNTIFAFVIVGIVFYGCKPAKYLEKDDYLLQKNSVQLSVDKTELKNLGFESYELEDLIKPKANTKLLRMPVYLYLYNMVNPEKAAEKKIKKDEHCNKKIDDKTEKIDFSVRLLQKQRDLYEKGTSKYLKYDKKLKEKQSHKTALDRGKCDWKSVWQKIGEPPVIYRPSDAVKSAKQMKIFLKNKGYYYAEINPKIVKKNEKTHEIYISYSVNPGKPYKISELDYNIQDSALQKIIVKDSTHTLLKKGKRLDTDLLQQERNRIELILRNSGYFKFSKDYITYTVDTLAGGYNSRITMNLRQVTNEKGTKENHKRFVFNNVYIYPNFDPKAALVNKDSYFQQFDTTNYIYNSKYSFIFLNCEKQALKSKAMVRGIYIYKDSLFNINDIEDSYHYLSALKIIKIANINLTECKSDSVSALKSNIGKLDCVIKLTQDKRQSYTFELTGTNTSGNIGAAGNLLFQHRNLFGNGEVLDLNFKLAAEGQTKVTSDFEKYFNSKEYGAELNLRFPRLLAPIKLVDFSKHFTPKTEISLVYNLMDFPDYRRTISGISYNYYWNTSESVKHIFQPVILDHVKLEHADSAFQAYIARYSLQESYENHLILGTSYSAVINNQVIKHKRNYTYFKFYAKTAGNFLTGLNEAENNPKNDGVYTILTNSYAQFVKGEFDFRYYRILGRYNDKIGVRTFAAMAYPYGNSTTIPFSEKYFSGGANSIRAWQVRTLGPGSYVPNDSTAIYPNQTGDIKLEANFEYRMKLFWMIEGAFFIDAGNIWAVNNYDTREGAVFKYPGFYKEIAVGTGYGFRMDFDFFIIRFDFGLKLRQPFLDNGKYWIPGNRKFTNSDWAFSVAIGYPF
jgi:outer membrane protein assembly factor BamA